MNGILTATQFQKAEQFVFRHGRLLDRKWLMFHFHGGSRESVLQALAAYQNPDGGFGHGLEADLMCPASTAICTEIAMGYLDDLGVTAGPLVDGIERWCIEAQQPDGSMAHPKADIEAYPHGQWWERSSGSVLSLAGFLGKWGRGSDPFFARAERAFAREEIPEQLGKYDYPLYLYLCYAPGADRHADLLQQVRDRIPGILDRFAAHHPLFVFPYRWYSDNVGSDALESRARALAADLQGDGGLAIPYDLPWWRPIWTAQALVSLKRYGLLG